MRRLKKVTVAMGLCLAMVNPLGVLAAEAPAVACEVEENSDKITPRVAWSGTAYVEKGKWCNVTSSNNIFPDKPKVTNGSASPGKLQVRIVNEAGKIIGSVMDVEVGGSVKMDNIPALSGTYTLQANAVELSGTYYISID